MKKIVISLIFLCLLTSCGERDDKMETNTPNLLDLIESSGEVFFIDYKNNGIMKVGEHYSYCKLIFKGSRKVYFESWAYNNCRFHGEFQMTDNTINISLDGFYGVFQTNGEPTPIIFPALELVDSPDGLKLMRKDGETHLKEHWNVYEGIHIFPMILIPTPNES